MKAHGGTELAELTMLGIERGWIMPPSPASVKVKRDQKAYRKAYYRKRRDSWHRQGLNSQGKPRRNKARPELAGIPRSEYHDAYMRLIRGTL